MTDVDPILSYEEFWKFYVREHSHPKTRWMHFIGTSMVIGLGIAGLLFSPIYFITMPIAGYSFAWASHFLFEKNRPATFKFPLWSLRADFQMYGYILNGRMNSEVRKYAKKKGDES